MNRSATLWMLALCLVSCAGLAACDGASIIQPNMADPIARTKAFPYSEKFHLAASSRAVREAVGRVLTELGLERVDYEVPNSDDAYLQSDYQGLIGARTPFGEEVLVIWQASGEGATNFELARRTPERSYLSYSIATRTFKMLNLDIPVTQPTTDAATLPAKK